MINKLILIRVLKRKETLKLTSDNYCKFIENQVFDASLKTGKANGNNYEKKQKREQRLRSEFKVEKKTNKKDKLS